MEYRSPNPTLSLIGCRFIRNIVAPELGRGLKGPKPTLTLTLIVVPELGRGLKGAG